MIVKKSTKQRKVTVYDNVSELYNEYLETYFDQYMAVSDNKKVSWVIINMILLIYFLLIRVIMITGLKMKNRLIQKERVVKKNLKCHH